jgi:hypothetical protein
MFLVGLLKLIYFPSRLPFLDIFIAFAWVMILVLGVEAGRMGLIHSISSLLTSFY